MTDSVALMVRKFHEAYGAPVAPAPRMIHPARQALRYELIREELGELGRAADIIAVADALADLAYVVYGAAIEYGIDLDRVIAAVHASNMTKLGPDGRPIYREDGKVLKGPGYVPPDIAGALAP